MLTNIDLPDMIWVRLTAAKYLKNNTRNFLQIIKTNSATNAWNNILDHRDLLKKGLFWYLEIEIA